MNFTVKRSDFPANFSFGVSTSSYQIEGGQGPETGRGPSIWDSFSATPGNVVGAEDGAVACDHYNRFPEDVALIKAGGFDAYRFSFAWPRLIPQGTGARNEVGFDFYDRLIDALLAADITPSACLYHWDLPSALQDRGGWMNRDSANWFTDYALAVQARFGDRLAQLSTFNEPWCSSYLSHFVGAHAPGYRDVRAAARAMHHILLAHGRATAALREAGQENLGLILNFEHCEPATTSVEDAAAAERMDQIYNQWFLNAVLGQGYPPALWGHFEQQLRDHQPSDFAEIAQPLDWLGINYYTRNIWADDPSGAWPHLRQVPGPLPKTDMGWEVYPQGLTKFILRAQEAGAPPIYITENGLADAEPYDDRQRIEFYDAHLKALLTAVDKGADVRGFYAWSLLDNFEWAFGYDKRFGLVHVDYRSQVRTPKASFRAFKSLLS